jgi:MFS family permease
LTRTRALALLALALVLSMTTWFSATAVVPQLREEWNLSSNGAALLTISVQLGFVVGALLSSLGNVADVFAPRVVILVGALGAATANALVAATSSAVQAAPLRALTGFCLAGVYPPALKLMATWYRSGRGLALGTLVGL